MNVVSVAYIGGKEVARDRVATTGNEGKLVVYARAEGLKSVRIEIEVTQPNDDLIRQFKIKAEKPTFAPRRKGWFCYLTGII